MARSEASPLSEQVDDEAGDRDLRADKCRSLDPQGAVELATGDEFGAIGFGRSAKLRRYGFGLAAFDTSGHEVAGGSACVEGRPVHGWITSFLLRRSMYATTRFLMLGGRGQLPTRGSQC